MRCPYCAGNDTQVKDSRPTEENAAIRRRRVCPDCGGRFTTFERVQLREMTVVKRSGKRAVFSRDKLSHSVEIALRKRPVEPERIERMVSGIVRQLESLGEPEIPCSTIGALVMDALKAVDGVAYVRFASVYKDFREVSDFHDVLGELSQNAGADAGGDAGTDSDVDVAADMDVVVNAGADADAGMEADTDTGAGAEPNAESTPSARSASRARSTPRARSVSRTKTAS